MEKIYVPRLLVLLYLLEQDFGISKNEISITEGNVSSDMVRRTPYMRVIIESLDRVVYICDEEGNASYIFDMELLKGHSLSLEEIDLENKGDMKELIRKYPGIGTRIRQSSSWRNNVYEVLANVILIEIEKSNEGENKEVKFESEFKKEYLTFDEFQEEIRSLYGDETNIYAWYKSIRRTHKRWPALPDTMYKDKGWKSWPELVGKEKREIISFRSFKEKVKSIYGGQTNIEKWYVEERKQHSDWPRNPEATYKGLWQSWADLLDKEQIKYLSYDEFQKEVISLYVEGTSLTRWYRVEQEKHKNWPSNPHQFYKNNGWHSWLGLIGREKKHFLPFSVFRERLNELYPGDIGIQEWYKTEQEKHNDWPKKPDDRYENDGWINWFDLVGKEKKKFPIFDEFQKEVIEAYLLIKDITNISEWYEEERVKHDNWPARPQGTYKNHWRSWPELVGKEKVEKLQYADFKKEAGTLYPGIGSVEKWYEKEKVLHDDWPALPDRYYAKRGWVSWFEITGKRKFIDFINFKDQVMKLYNMFDGSMNIQKWYRIEKGNHNDWPSNPDETYKNEGWKNWTELTGREKVELLSFEELKKEVISLYPGAIGIKDWYSNERKKHASWPSTPARIYENKGWTNWGDFIKP